MVIVKNNYTYSDGSTWTCLLMAFSMSSFGFLDNIVSTISRFRCFSILPDTGANFLFLLPPGTSAETPTASFSLGSLFWNFPRLAVDAFATVTAV